MSLIDSIYDAVEDDELYRLLPKTLAENLGGRSATILMYSPKFSLQDVITYYFSDEMNQYYQRNNFHLIDEWTNAFSRVPNYIGRTIRSGDYISDAEFSNSTFYREFIRYFGDDSVHCMGFMHQFSDGSLLSLGVHKGRSTKDFDDNSLNILDKAKPHLVRMASLREKLRTASAVAEVAASGLNSMSHAILVLDDRCQVRFANISAEQMLCAGTPLSVREGKLKAEGIESDLRLANLIRAALDRSGDRGGSMMLQTAGEFLRLHVSPQSVGQRTFALVLIERADLPRDANSRLASIYELTETEAKVAVQAAEGHSAEEIGGRLLVSVPTVRTHLQHIFRKMDITKASQLARLVASLPGFRANLDERDDLNRTDH